MRVDLHAFDMEIIWNPKHWPSTRLSFLRATKRKGKIRIEMNLEGNSQSHFFMYFIVISGNIYAVILNPTP
jgi:hypothetical protein